MISEAQALLDVIECSTMGEGVPMRAPRAKYNADDRSEEDVVRFFSRAEWVRGGIDEHGARNPTQKQKLSVAAYREITAAAILAAIGTREVPISDIKSRTGIHPHVVGTVVSRMVRAGVLERVPDGRSSKKGARYRRAA